MGNGSIPGRPKHTPCLALPSLTVIVKPAQEKYYKSFNREMFLVS